MFHVNYKLFQQDGALKGAEGYFQLSFNQIEYGLILQKELAVFSVSVYDWFHGLLKAATLLKEEFQVFIQDRDVPGVWIELRKLDSDVISICEVHTNQPDNQQAVKCGELTGLTYPHGSNNFVSMRVFNEEIRLQTQGYLRHLKRLNAYDHPAILLLEGLLTELDISRLNPTV